ncbi:MAG: argininosuccinate lyase [Elusimicrobia bacterium]|nr:argininosuccinate lyase [Elusimicrobiota bacterium]
MSKLWQVEGQTLDEAVQRFTVGEDPVLDRRLLPYEVTGTLAHAKGLVKLGLLSDGEWRAIRTELGRLLEDESFVILPEQEDIHTAVEQRLTERLGELGKSIHAGRSRNDQVQTDLRLFMMDRLLELHAGAAAAAGAWSAFAGRHAKVLMPGYTHLQRAMPTTAGHWAASHVEALLDGCRSIRQAFDEADASPLGSAAGYGAPLPLDRAFTARLMGFTRVQLNTLRVQTSRPRIDAAVISALALVAKDLGVLAGDLCLFATAEFGFMKLDPAFTTGSSIMPQKRNPDVAELLRARAAQFPGWVLQALSAGPAASGYHRDFQLSKRPLFAALDAAAAMVDMAARLAGAVRVDAARCRAAVTQDLLATQRALDLVKKGLPFREAYRRVAAAARQDGQRTAGRVDLPAYLGAPGNPGLRALASGLAAEARWNGRRGAALRGAWKRLLRG